MLDTKLKKTNKWKVLIIALCVLLPAAILTGLYPRMEKVMLEKREAYEEEIHPLEQQTWEVSYNFVNYVVEACYYLYGLTMQELNKAPVDFGVLDAEGWINDYYQIHEQTEYYAEYVGNGLGESTLTEGDDESISEVESSERMTASGTVTRTEESMAEIGESAVETNGTSETGDGTGSPIVMKNTDKELEKLLDLSARDTYAEDLYSQGMLGYLTIEFNSYGQITDIGFKGRDDVWYETNLYIRAKESVERYENNMAYHGNVTSAKQVCPKDFRAVFVINEGSSFSYQYYEPYSDFGMYRIESIYLDMGIIWIILILAVLVAAAALILPFVKRLNTGWEKLFSMSAEVLIALGIAGIMGAVGMYYAMLQSSMYCLEEYVAVDGVIELVGYQVSVKTAYVFVLFLNFLGWALCFLVEYVVVAGFRQFLCGPAKYLKERVWAVRIMRRFLNWCRKKSRQFYDYITDIQLTEKLQQSIVKILIVNFTLLMLYCLLLATNFLGIFDYAGEGVAMFGLILLLVYHIWLYMIMRRYGGTLQKQYFTVLDAAHEMAEGNLKIAMKEEELGVMQPIGRELGRVQQGFAKAVAEEAKSQNMKTELITNVSHDLKTPLTAIITYVDLLKKEDLTEEERKSYVATLDQKSQRLKVLIEDLFEVSKATSGNIRMNFMEVDVVNLMKQVRLEMEDKITASGLTFRWNLPEEKVILYLDGQRTYRVFENLLNNILKYSMPLSRVYVDIVEKAGTVQIIFRNMSATELDFDAEKLTERFVRGDASRKTEGSGLGLAIVKSFVELQNGKVDINVDGDLFKVTLTWTK